MTYAANMDYASGGYGAYNPAALTDPHIGGVIINMNWANVEKANGFYTWAPLRNTLAAWAQAGKRVGIVLRFATEVGGGTTNSMLPQWEQARIPTFLDTIQNSVIPDYFNATFKKDWKTYVNAVASQIAASPYKSAVSYVRIATGLGGESWPLMPKSKSTYMPKLQAWGYTPDNWEAWQKEMLSYYHSVLPAGIPGIYSIVKLDNNSAGVPIQVEVAKWAVSTLGFGVGEESIPPGSFGNWAEIDTICNWVHTNYPKAYIQFQTAGPLNSTSDQLGIISNAKAHWAKSLEWYESGITNSAWNPGFDSWQNWVNANMA